MIIHNLTRNIENSKWSNEVKLHELKDNRADLEKRIAESIRGVEEKKALLIEVISNTPADNVELLQSDNKKLIGDVHAGSLTNLRIVKFINKRNSTLSFAKCQCVLFNLVKS